MMNDSVSLRHYHGHYSNYRFIGTEEIGAVNDRNENFSVAALFIFNSTVKRKWGAEEWKGKEKKRKEKKRKERGNGAIPVDK